VSNGEASREAAIEQHEAHRASGSDSELSIIDANASATKAVFASVEIIL
jgi:hypothetical protein